MQAGLATWGRPAGLGAAWGKPGGLGGKLAGPLGPQARIYLVRPPHSPDGEALAVRLTSRNRYAVHVQYRHMPSVFIDQRDDL